MADKIPTLITLGQKLSKMDAIKHHNQTHGGHVYNSAWVKVRNKKLSMNPLCEECLKHDVIKEATLVHHIIPVDVRPELKLVMDNLMSVCNVCHGKIHAEMDKHKQPHRGK